MEALRATVVVARAAAVAFWWAVTFELACVAQGYTGPAPEADAAVHGIRLEVVKHLRGTRGFVPLPRRWVGERSLAWKTRLRRLVRDCERRLSILSGLHLIAFACLALTRTMSARLVW